MIIISGIIDLIQNTPKVVDLLLYGFIFIIIFQWLTNEKMEMYSVIIWALFVNVFIKAVCGVIHSYAFPSKNFDENIKVVVYILTAIVMSGFISWIYNSVEVKQMLSKLGKKTFGNDVLKDVIDYDKKTMMLVYLKNDDVIYGGTFKARDERGIESYIVLIEYCLYVKNSGKIIRDSSNQKASVVINMKDVERVEMLYENDSKVWKFLNQDNEEKVKGENTNKIERKMAKKNKIIKSERKK